MLAETKKSVYEQVVYDFDTERSFADDLEKNTAVKVYEEEASSRGTRDDEEQSLHRADFCIGTDSFQSCDVCL